ncbi:universal stress protein [Streptacidiphilus sp. PB12-B1b]|uniref:universal stress protein n=1 Tax=Streptacidiphilus sp. PB12-B1b TaxID=2705012 RepID=UPI0015FCB24C|nr:universal stress protein [Streptacidiphilus sp. PB12-B1b]QMU77623.1 universal stress protein [Streptacidiphilus sp. PB12-B1b]
MESIRPFLVAVDGSDDAWAALEWTARAAARVGAPLRVLNVEPTTGGLAEVLLGPGPEPSQDSPVTGEAVDRAKAVAPGLAVATRVVSGDPRHVLPAQSRGAALLVTGTRGLSGLRGWLAGSVSRAAAGYARCPVVVHKRAEDVTAGHILIGLDPFDLRPEVLAFAVSAAHALEAPLRLIVGDLPSTERADAARDELETVLAALHQDHPALDVTAEYSARDESDWLVELSRTAELVAVGRELSGVLMTDPLGRAADALLDQAHCPVAVVPARTR